MGAINDRFQPAEEEIFVVLSEDASIPATEAAVFGNEDGEGRKQAIRYLKSLNDGNGILIEGKVIARRQDSGRFTIKLS